MSCCLAVYALHKKRSTIHLDLTTCGACSLESKKKHANLLVLVFTIYLFILILYFIRYIPHKVYICTQTVLDSTQLSSFLGAFLLSDGTQANLSAKV